MSLQGRLKRYYREFLRDTDVQLVNFQAISDGWETEVYRFAQGYNGVFKSRILRMYPGTDAVEKCEREFQGLRQLKASGYPVPEVFEHSADPIWLGKPFIVMQKIDGAPLGRIMQMQSEHFPELLARFVTLLVDLHRLDYNPFLWLSPVMLQNDPAAFLHLKLAEGRRLIVDQMRQTWAIPVMDWLDAGAASITPQIAVMHEDFHPWNILISADDSAYVIDWGGIEVGDYRYDLGWTLVLSGTHGSQAERDLVLSEYERLAGHPVEQIDYFEAFAALRRLFGFAASLSSGAESVGMRPEAAAIMRGQHERFRRVYDVVRTVTGLRLPEIERLLDHLAAGA